MMKFGALVRDQREAAGISMRDFADRLGVSAAYWSKIERDLEKPPSDVLIEASANSLGIPLDDVYVAANRIPPDIRKDIRRAVSLYRDHQAEVCT